jgi:hypothetical protein
LQLSTQTDVDVRLSQWFAVDVDSALWSLHHVDVDSVAGVSDIHAASIFTVEGGRLGEFLCLCFLVSQKPWEENLVPVPTATR